MQIVFPDTGLSYWMARMVALDLHLHLYATSVSITRATILSDLTEAAWTGYAPGNLSSLSWTFSTLGHVCLAVGTPIAFLNSGGAPATFYGWYVTDVGDIQLLAAGQMDGAPLTIAIGDSAIVIPSIGDLSRAIISP